MADNEQLHRHRFGGLTHRHERGDQNHSHGSFGGDRCGWGPAECWVCRHSIEACTCPMNESED